MCIEVDGVCVCMAGREKYMICFVYININIL
jgi:hypothetical protein